MDEELRYELPQGVLQYHITQDGAVIERYRGSDEAVVIPEKLDALPVKAIGKKAFLSCKALREVELPQSVTEIGDWAFAHAEGLRRVVLPRGEVRMGREVFLGCKRLRELAVAGTEAENGVARMLAMAVTALHDYYLLATAEAGSAEWLRRWDERLTDFLRQSDMEGYEELGTCGEEDYEGKDYDSVSYPVKKRMVKLRMVYYRLLHPQGLSEAMRSFYMEYLRAHTLGTAQPEAWRVLIDEHAQELDYYRIFTEAGCVTEDNFDALLADMRDVNAELKAYLLRYKDGHFAKKDAFAAFTLDW